jgi:hypothetical protein
LQISKMVCRLTGNINVGDEQSGDNWSVKCSKTNYQHEEEQEVARLHEKQRKLVIMFANVPFFFYLLHTLPLNIWIGLVGILNS